MIVTSKEYNAMQDREFAAYKAKCKKHGVEPHPQSRYFERIPYKTGYVRFNSFGEYRWAKRKKDLL